MSEKKDPPAYDFYIKKKEGQEEGRFPRIAAAWPMNYGFRVNPNFMQHEKLDKLYDKALELFDAIREEELPENERLAKYGDMDMIEALIHFKKGNVYLNMAPPKKFDGKKSSKKSAKKYDDDDLDF